jgi:hypothetical protein
MENFTISSEFPTHATAVRPSGTLRVGRGLRVWEIVSVGNNSSEVFADRAFHHAERFADAPPALRIGRGLEVNSKRSRSRSLGCGEFMRGA